MQRTPYPVPSRPYRLTKRFRRDEEYTYLPKRRHWTKSLINKKEGTVLGRTPYRWLQLLVFYAIFYTVLAVLCTTCWFFSTFSRSALRPLVIHPQPGFCLEPAIDNNVVIPRIEYAADDEDRIDVYVQKIDQLLDKYGAPEQRFPGCSSEELFGFKDMEPCVFLKVNRMIGFRPEPYDDYHDLPAEAPKELKDLIQSMGPEDSKNRLWVSCQAGPGDHPKLRLVYQPGQSVPASLLDVDRRRLVKGRDYSEQDFERIVAVKIVDSPRDTLVPFKCLLWAKNIAQDHKGTVGLGVVKFELLIHSIPSHRQKSGP